MEINTQLILTIINVLAGSSVVGILIASILSRKKTHAETADLIQRAAGELIDKYRDHNKDLLTECVGLKDTSENLRKELEELKETVEANKLVSDTCQTQLTQKINALELEKAKLKEQVHLLMEQVEALQDENKRLKMEREIEKAVIA